MARTTTPSSTEIERLLQEYENRTQSRREFCEEHGLAEHTLHYYQRRLREQKRRESSLVTAARDKRAGLARVKVQGATTVHAEQHGDIAVAVVLANGRRVELAHWAYRDAELVRLIRVVEEA